MNVTIELRDPIEIEVVGRMMLELYAYRNAKPEPKSQVIAHISPEGMHPVSDEEITAAVLAYGERAGIPACLALMEEFGAKRAKEIPAARRAEFIGRTQERKAV